MNLSFKNRIAIYYMVATATVMALVFGAIFFLVNNTVWQNLDNDLSFEAFKHTREIKIAGDSIKFINKAEWEEREHQEIQVNPVFIQLIDKEGRLMDKSPNLKQDQLPLNDAHFGGHFNATLSDRNIRQVQMPIEREGKIEGYILAAMSAESSISVISKLRNVLLISYFIVLIGLYFVSRFIAGRSIIPIQEMTATIARITRDNLQERVSLPPNHDEIHTLSANFNALLDRIEKAVEREKQFTSDASHELRTPLAILRGTLEVLIRKPRTHEEYKEKIAFSLSEVERMTMTLEQLLLLARSKSLPGQENNSLSSLPLLIDESIAHFQSLITEKNLKISLKQNHAVEMLVPSYYSSSIIDNVMSNAIKYSHPEGIIEVSIDKVDGGIDCTITDSGIGIKEDDLPHIYNSFYRSDALEHKQIAGSGLGLAIAKKCAYAIAAEIKVISTYGSGTKVVILFQDKARQM